MDKRPRDRFGNEAATETSPPPAPLVPGKRTLAESQPRPRASQVTRAAEAGVASASAPLPHRDIIQRAFGRHAVHDVRARVGGEAAEASAAIGASAYALGDRTAFARAPDLHTAAHEAAHVVQQRRGVALDDGVGSAGDAHEKHADEVADRVVAGESAEDLLDAAPGGGGGAGVQRKELPGTEEIEETPAMFFNRSASTIRAEVVNQMAANELQIGSPYLCWAVGTFGVDVVESAFGIVTTYASMKRLLVGSDFDVAMNRAHADDNTTTSMAIELKGLFLSRIAASLQRISPRYVIARHQALLRAEAAAKRSVAPDSAPQPNPGEVITSHPMDRHVLARFVAGAVKWNSVEQFRKDHPGEAKQHEIAKARSPVVLTVKSSRWVHVTEPHDATVEEVARELFGTTEGAVYVTKATPLFGIEPAAWKAYPLSKYAPKAPTVGDLLLGDTASAAAGLGAVPEVSAISAKQSETLIADGLGSEGVAARLSLLRLTIGDLGKSAAKLGLEQTVAPVVLRIAKREQELATGAPRETVTSFDAISKAQLETVRHASAGVSQALGAVASVHAPAPTLKGNGGAAQIAFDKLIAPSRALASAYLDAIALSDLPEAAKSKLTEADALATTFPIDVANTVLEQVRRLLDHAEGLAASAKTSAKKGTADIDLGRELEKEVRRELVELKATIATDPNGAQTKLVALQNKLQDAIQVAQTAVAVWGLQSLIEQLVVHKSKLGAVSGKNKDYDAAIKKLQMFSQTFKDEVFTPYTTGDTEAKKAATKKFQTLKHNPVLVDLQKDLPEFIQSQEEFEHWLSFFILIEVSFVAGALGSLTARAAGFTGEWASVKVLATEAGVETAVNTAYSVLITKEPKWQHVLAGMAQTMANAVAMKKLMPPLQGALHPKLGKVGTEVALLPGVFASVAMQKLAVAIALDPALSEEKARELLRDAAAEVIGGAIFNYFGGKFLGAFEHDLKKHPELEPKVAAIDAGRKAVTDEANAVAHDKGDKTATIDTVLKKAADQAADEAAFVKKELPKLVKDPGSTISPEILEELTLSAQRLDYQFKKTAVLDKLKHVAGDTYLAEPKEFVEISQQLRDLGYEAIGEESFEPVKSKPGRSVRFEPKKGPGAPPDSFARPIRLCENGPPIENAKSVTVEAFATVIKDLAAGKVPKLVDLPNTVANFKAHIALEKIAADPVLAGPLASLKQEFFAEYAGKLTGNPPETNMLQRLQDVLGTPAGTAKYLRKGPVMTDPAHVAELGGLYRIVSLRALIGNRYFTQSYYDKILAAGGEAEGFPRRIAEATWGKEDFPGRIAKFINDHGLHPTAADFAMDTIVEGRGKGSSSWWNAGKDSMPKGPAKTTIPDLVASLAVDSTYNEGCVLLELPADVATGQVKPKNSSRIPFDGRVHKPNALDAFMHDMFVANPDPNAPEGLTAPDPASGRAPVREAVVGPVPLSATRIVQYLVGK